MAETSESPLNIRESENTSEPLFIQKMSKDYPKLADKIADRLPGWKKDVDNSVGVEGLAETLISNIEYIDKEEFDRFIGSVTEEVEGILDEDPDQHINFVSWLTNKGSGRFFYEQVKDRIKTKHKEKLRLIDTHTPEEYLENEKRTVFFYVDDSSNSGQQLKQGVFAFRSMDAIDDKTTQILAEYPIDYRIRLMRITDYMRGFVEDPDRGQQRFMVDSKGNTLVQMDLNSNKTANNHMPTTLDVVNKLGINFDDLKKSFIIQQSHTTRTPATLAIFWHKIQDNMPIAILEGRVKTGFQPLITREEMDTYPERYESN